jgi:DNA recombination protein RmuC
MQFDVLSALICLAVGGLGVAAFLLPKLSRPRDDQALANTFDVLAQESMRKSQDQFLALATEKLKQAQMEGSHDLELRQKSIATLVDPIGKSLKDMDIKIETLGKTGAGLEAQLKTFADDQRHLREQTQNLVQALRNPMVRGKWGEMQLQRTFEMIGFIENVHYKTQVSTQTQDGVLKPDFLINLPNGVQIVIDVKTPLDPYWNLVDETNTQAYEKNLVSFRQKVRDHVKSLSAKSYWQQFNSPEFVVMFLPSESLYSTAIGSDSTLLEEASKAGIILASPTTVMGLLRVVMYGWQQQKMAEEAKNISSLAADLYGRISTFGDHIVKLGKNLGTTINTYNDAVGSMERSMLPTMRKLKELHVSTQNKDIPGTSLIETMPRPVTSQILIGEDAEIIPLKSQNQ